MKNDQFDELIEILKWMLIFLGCIIAVLVVMNLTIIVANAAPVAGATYQMHVQTMRAPVAEWQQDILETINEEPKKEETKNEQNNKRITRKKSALVIQRSTGGSNVRHLTRLLGVFDGPSGRETYYNLPMGGVIRSMGALGYNYSYWVRSDGVKMFGDYAICAADLSIRPKGTILQTSLGQAIVCDTGTFVNQNRYQIDIATNW